MGYGVSRESTRKNNLRVEKGLLLLTLVVIVVCWFVGKRRTEAELRPLLPRLFPKGKQFEQIDSSVFCVRDGHGKILGYAAVGEATGYGGKLKVLVAVSPEGRAERIIITEHRETSYFLERVLKRGFLKQLTNKSYQEAFSLGKDVDGVSGATYTCRAISEAVKKATRKVAGEVLGYRLPEEPEKPVRIGVPEVLIFLLFLSAFFARSLKSRGKKRIRWVILIISTIFIGFLYNKLLNLVVVNRFLTGLWPGWRTELYWYLLLAALLVVLLTEGENLYCGWICPFGAIQEGLGALGGFKKNPAKFIKYFRWFQRLLALVAVCVALIYRNPGKFNYEIYSSFFALIGTDLQFLLLGLILVLSLFVIRPWCLFLCPTKAIVDYVLFVRNWVYARFKEEK